MNAVSLTEVKMKGRERESGSESESGEDEAMKVEKKEKCKDNNEKYIEGKGCLLGIARSNWRVGMGIRKDQEGYG